MGEQGKSTKGKGQRETCFPVTLFPSYPVLLRFRIDWQACLPPGVKSAKESRSVFDSF